MIVGIPREVKKDEFRVGLLPDGARAFRREGHRVLFESGAGEGCGHGDGEYAQAGAEVVGGAAEVWGRADLVYKVKEPLAQEWPLIRSGQVVFTYFHFAASRELTGAMLKSGAVALAYETILERDGSLPCLVPMSEIAGRMSIQEGAKCLEKVSNGQGTLLAGVPGVAPAEVLILGGGVVGSNAARIAAGLGARVTVMDVSLPRLRVLDDILPANVTTLFSTPDNLERRLGQADLVVGAVLKEGARAPRLVTAGMLKGMKKGSALVDVSIDQGGCFETSRPTTHSQPTYVVEGVVHYCVSNMPGGVARTSTQALANATLPYALKLASLGWKKALAADRGFLHGLNLSEGRVHHPAVAEAFGLPLSPADKALDL